MTAHPHVVYRVYDAADRLLYVGRTSNLRKRLIQHKRTAAWFPFHARVEQTPYPGFVGAALAEIKAIRDEHPLFNRDDRTTKPAAIDADVADYCARH